MADPEALPDEIDDLADTLTAYEREKRARLADEGAQSLRRELAELDRFLQQAEGGSIEWATDRLVAFRREKARILRGILDEASGA